MVQSGEHTSWPRPATGAWLDDDTTLNSHRSQQSLYSQYSQYSQSEVPWPGPHPATMERASVDFARELSSNACLASEAGAPSLSFETTWKRGHEYKRSQLSSSSTSSQFGLARSGSRFQEEEMNASAPTSPTSPSSPSARAPKAQQTTSRPLPDEEPHTNVAFFITIACLFFGTFLVALDTTIIGTATPAITSTFHTLDDIAWYGSGYLLTLTALQPTFGKLFKVLNVKSLYLSCVLVFEAGSILCATAPNSPLFITGRAIAGCGAAGLLQGALIVIMKTVPLERRPFYTSIVISCFAVCVGIGPVLGGTFADHVTWRWCFWINVPIGAVVMVLVFVFLRVREDESIKEFSCLSWKQKLRRLDPAGTTLIINSIVCLLLAMQWGGQTLPWTSSKVIGLFVGSAILFSLFLFVQWRMGDDATLPFSILKNRSILSGGFYLLFFGMPTYAYGYYIPLYFQSIRGFSALKSGTEFLSLALPQIGFTVASGAIATKFGYYTPQIILGTAVSMVGSGLITMLDLDTSLGTWVAYFLVFAFGTGIAINHPFTAVQAVLSEADVPTGNAIMEFAFELGGALSLCIAQTVFLNRLSSQITQYLPDLNPKEVIAAGAHNLPLLANSPETLHLLRESYRTAIRDVFIFGLAAAGVALITSFGFEHVNVKKVAKERKELNDGAQLRLTSVEYGSEKLV